MAKYLKSDKNLILHSCNHVYNILLALPTYIHFVLISCFREASCVSAGGAVYEASMEVTRVLSGQREWTGSSETLPV